MHSTAKDSTATVRTSQWIVDCFRIAFDGQDSMATVHVTADDFRTAFNGYRAHHRGSWMTSEPHSTAKIRRLPCASQWIVDDFRNSFDGEDFDGYLTHHCGSWIGPASVPSRCGCSFAKDPDSVLRWGWTPHGPMHACVCLLLECSASNHRVACVCLFGLVHSRIAQATPVDCTPPNADALLRRHR